MASRSRITTIVLSTARLTAAAALAVTLAMPSFGVMAEEGAPGSSVSGAPAIPVPAEPADGAAFPSWAEAPAMSWQPVEGAEEYQVVLNGGERTSPWLGREKWAPGDLGEGTFTWQVLSRSQGGTSDLSPAWSFTISASAPPEVSEADAEAPEAAAAPAPEAEVETEVAETEPAPAPAASAEQAGQTDVAASGATLTLDAVSPLTVGQPLTLTGAGFTPGEGVTVRWLGDQGPIVGTTTAAEDGTFTFGMAVPETPIGDRPVVAIGDSDGKQAVAWYVIAPTFAVAPAEARPGDTVSLTLLGYGPAEPWEVRWGDGDGAVWASGETDANGGARLDMQVPEDAAGDHALLGLGLNSAGRAGAMVTLLDAAAAEPAPADGEIVVSAEEPAQDAAAAPELAPAPAIAPAAAPAEPAPAGTHTEGMIAAPPSNIVETTNDPANLPAPAAEEPAGEREKAPNAVKQAREENQLAIANQMREHFGLAPIPDEGPTAGAESAGAVAEDTTVDASANRMNGYLDPGTTLAGAPDAAEQAAPADPASGEIVAGQVVGLQQYTDGAPVPIPSAVYDLLPNPDAIGAVEHSAKDRRDQRDEQRQREEDRRDRKDGHDSGETPPADENTSNGNGTTASDTPEPDPSLPAPPPGTVLTFIPASDTSTGADAPDEPQPDIQVSVLPLGGPDSAAAFVTFDVSGIGGGKVAKATLTITGAIGFWGPVSVTALPGYWADESSLTWNTAPGGEILATDSRGEASGYPELPADGTVSADVTGTIDGDGLITFVLRGTPDVGQAIGSRESGIPAVLEIVTE